LWRICFTTLNDRVGSLRKNPDPVPSLKGPPFADDITMVKKKQQRKHVLEFLDRQVRKTKQFWQ